MRTFLIVLLPIFLFSQQPQKEEDLFRREKEVISPSLEFLYWSLEESDLDFAVKMNRAAWGASPTHATGALEEAETGFRPGFRAALSYFRATRYWEIKTAYTFYYHNKRKIENKPDASDLFLVSSWPTNLLSPIDHAESTLRFHYHLADFLVARVFIPNPHLRLRLAGGLTGALFSQRWQTNYFDTNNSTDVKNRWRFIGAGMRMGVVMDWFWTSDIYLLGGFSLASLLGRYHNLSKIETTANPGGLNNPDVPFQDINKKDLRLANQIQFFLGPSWEKSWTSLRAEVFAGYELNSWWNLQEIYRSLAGSADQAKQIFTNTSMLSLHGLSARITLDF